MKGRGIIQVTARSSHRHLQGQILVMTAFLMVVMIGIMGLATDLGYSVIARRTMQNAADAGALAGAQQLTKWDASQGKYTNNQSVFGAVQSVVASNTFGSVTPTITDCRYVDASGADLGTCGTSPTVAPPATASGITVSVNETHSTFFIRAVPGGPTTASTSAAAAAAVFQATLTPGDAPFIVCGDGFSGNLPNILNPDGTINPAAIGKTYKIHGPQINTCGAGSAFKGLADDNTGKTLGEWWDGNNGVHAGPTRSAVSGVAGCQKNATDPYNCIMILPVADEGKGNGSHITMHVVAIAAFYVGNCGANCHTGQLIGQYVVGPNDTWPISPSSTWKVGDNGILMLRLVQ